MTTLTLSFILISVFLSVVAQILLKHGMSNGTVQTALTSDVLTAGIAIFSNISVVAGLTAYVSSAGIWLLVLSKIDVSKAYPFVGIGFIGTMLFAYWFLNEPLTLTKVVGTLLVLAGVLLISQ
jgi:multidrug transporter EmrE-like cation transporter